MLTVSDVADFLDSWKSYGEYGMALCIEHDDHSPSMKVTQRGYFCKACFAHGSLEKLYQFHVF